MRRPAPAQPNHPRRCAGVSMLEATLSVAMLALVASTITAAIAQNLRAEERNEQRLGAYEVANRIVLQYLDAPIQVEGLGTGPIDYGRYRYRFELSEAGFEMRNSDAGEELAQGVRGSAGAQASRRYRAVTIRVWIADADDPSGTAPAAEMMAELTRLYDPVHMRNPDSFDRQMQDPAMVERIMQRLQGGG